jgi:hypothetical protein
VVPSSSHKQKVAGSILAGCTKTFLFSLPLLPHRLTSCFDVGRHLSFHEKSAQEIAATTETTARPAHVEKKKALPLQSTEAGFLVRVHPEPCLILSRAQIRALLCLSKSKVIPAQTLTLLVLDKKTGLWRGAERGELYRAIGVALPPTWAVQLPRPRALAGGPVQ